VELADLVPVPPRAVQQSGDLKRSLERELPQAAAAQLVRGIEGQPETKQNKRRTR
jgi:hypothetical protein